MNDSYEQMQETIDNGRRFLEQVLIAAAIDYSNHYSTFSFDGPMSEKELRMWGHENYEKHRRLLTAVEQLKYGKAT